MTKARAVKVTLLDSNQNAVVAATFRTSKMHNTRKVVFPVCILGTELVYFRTEDGDKVLISPLQRAIGAPIGTQAIFPVGALKITEE